VAGPEFGSDEGKNMIVVRALYWLKSTGATFRTFLGQHLCDMGFRSSQADPDVWLRPARKPGGEKYYELSCATWTTSWQLALNRN
jgi:hypothetical protein